MRKISADYIYPINTKPIRQGVLITDDYGRIIDLLDNDTELMDVEYFSGRLCPGFVNTHCHLELSHLREKISEKTGLINFIMKVQNIRAFLEEEIINAMIQAEQELIQNGIVAVGDISNYGHSFELKRKKNIYYHTFIELIGFNPNNALAIFNKGLELRNSNPDLTISLTPHSPYSVSSELFKQIANYDFPIISIHNQESEEENKLFKKGEGDFLRLYKEFGIDISYFNPPQTSSLKTYLPYFNSQKILLVHNTFTNESDIDFALNTSNAIYWCLCPNANLYIEEKIPNIPLLLTKNAKITIGTDSLASNHALSILDELITIQKAFPQISFETLLQWGTLNGAEFLGIDHEFGSFEKGKKPGINLITEEYKVIKII